MANVGPALYPGSSTFPGASVFPGQGNNPIIRLRLSTDDASVGELRTWTNIETSLRSYSVSRGHDAPLSEVDAGTATFQMDNRTRAFDPLNNAAIRPFNRYWLYEEFSGSVRDIFYGYAQSYGQTWPEAGIDAVAIVQCADELAVLASAALPTTNPPRASYADLIASDLPDGYWDMSEDSTGRTRLAAPDPSSSEGDSGTSNPRRAVAATDRRADLRTGLLKDKRRH